MQNNQRNELAKLYHLDDIPCAYAPTTRLSMILARLEKKAPLTKPALDYLKEQELSSLYLLATNVITPQKYHHMSKGEKIYRKEIADMLILEKEKEEKDLLAARQANIKLAQEKIIAAQILREEDPEYIAALKKQKALLAAKQARNKPAKEKARAAHILREKDPEYITKKENEKRINRYKIDPVIEQDILPTLMDILKRLDNKKRLFEKDILWLSTIANKYYSNPIKLAYHNIEAEFYSQEFNKTQDPWMAINASSHYRKCNIQGLANKLLHSINIEENNSAKLKSAFFTTFAGVKRDIGRKDEALTLGKKAHLLMNNDFRPCTLLGAVYMETGCFDLGQEWYDKAADRGAPSKSIDSELRSIYLRADKPTQQKFKVHLLNIDPHRYAWVKKAGLKR